MSRQAKGSVFSILLHIFLVYGLISLTAAMENDPPPPVLNFNLIAESRIQQKSSPVVDEPPIPKTVKKIEPVEPFVPEPEPVPLEKVAVFKPEVVKKKIIPRVEPAPIQPKPTIVEKTIPPDPVIHRTVSKPVAHKEIKNRVTQAPLISPREVYVKEQFSYIKNAIQRTINYPRLARRMGWEGKVVISFIVSKDGNIDKARVIESSGYTALDKNALETIEKSTPFPKPPARAELIVPVVYRLRG